MKQTIQLRLGQQLTMTPQLQQAIRLLQLSAAELTLEIQQALESNMMLELDEEDEVAPETEESHGPNGEEEAEAPDEVELAGSEDPGDQIDIPVELPVDTDWDDIYAGAAAAPQRTTDANGFEFENQAAPSEGLHEHLLWQVNLMPATERERAIGLAIVDAIGEDGYLGAGINEICETLNGDDDVSVTPEEVEAVLRQVQGLDPAGVGARDLQECLLLQLDQLAEDTARLAQARLLVQEHLDLLGDRDYGQLMRKLKIDKDALREVITLIQSLNPRPGAHLEESRVEYIVPDVYVRKQKGGWHVELNPDTVPHLRVNQHYASMIRRADNSEDNNSLKAHLQEARWLIKSLQSRSETLLRVATTIVERQRDFLEHGEEAMKPLVLHDVADALGMHESTISRVTTRKYMHTPRGIYELKYFFSSHVNTSLGGEASSTAIRAVIKKLIAAEDSERPLSDSKIAALLGEQGIPVARRTVAKYREAMHIPPSGERKRLN